ncbi:hypothetical protein ACLI1C_16165 [Devosia sp. XGJD_8]|uniref:hypothetical protein n=1 Tax=Devosia sp. XGJD_8 TaxID=3391187 RepID=UPI003985084C
MADRSILFSGPMVRALLAGDKTQTRRRMGYQLPAGYTPAQPGQILGGTVKEVPFRFSVGDQLYVREHWRTDVTWAGIAPRDIPEGQPVEYQAGGFSDLAGVTVHFGGAWRRGMHMPRWASRITLKVTDVRAERLQDISEADAKAEGLQIHLDGDADDNGRARLSQYYRGSDKLEWVSDPVEAYLALWDAINGAGAAEANPWVAAYTFTVRQVNIDGQRCKP